MDRETRKANFKKLQLPSNSKSRTHNNHKSTTTNPAISEYFNTPTKLSQHENENSTANPSIPAQPPPKVTCKRTKLTSFVFNGENAELSEIQIKKPRESEVFEPVPVQKVKKAPKLKNNAKKSTARKPRGGGAKKQLNIKSAFLRNEQAFAEITAQHCLADNFNPDDIELALAISKSESEKNDQIYAVEQDEVVDIQEEESIRNKLQKYGFRTAAKQDYNALAAAFLPGSKRSKKTKWANKFTPLTLRNPDIQLQKVKAKVEEFLAKQNQIKPLKIEEEVKICDYCLISSNLKHFQPESTAKIFSKEIQLDTDLSQFYVTELFQPSTIPVGHLLKDWTAIQGRDLSPARDSPKKKACEKRLHEAYIDLEAYFSAKQQLPAAIKKTSNELKILPCGNDKDNEKENINIVQSTKPTEELDELINLMKVDQAELSCTEAVSKLSSQQICTANIMNEKSPIKEPPDKRVKVSDEKVKTAQNSSPIKPVELLKLPTTTLPRAKTPDLFADSDDDDSEVTAIQKWSLEVYKHNSPTEAPHSITTYEIYSSDEVKTTFSTDDDNKINANETPTIKIDLTQDDKNEKSFFEYNTQASNSSIDSNLFASSPTRHQTNASGLCDLLPQTQNNIHSILKDVAVQSDFLNQEENYELNSSCNKEIECPIIKLSSSSPTSTSSSSNLCEYILGNSSLRKTCSFIESNTASSLSMKLPRYTSELALKTQKSDSFSDMKNFIEDVSIPSIDLTQTESDDQQDDDANDNDSLILSDDEINYSIWKANKTTNLNEDEGSFNDEKNDSKSTNVSSQTQDTQQSENDVEDDLLWITDDDDLNFSKKSIDIGESFMEDLKQNSGNNAELDAFLLSTQTSYIESGGNSRSPNKSALSRERAEFGILDAALSEPPSNSQINDKESINWSEASFLDSPTEKVTTLKRYSTCTSKFNEFFTQINNKSVNDTKSKSALDDLDEFDRIVYGAMEEEIKKKQTSAAPVPQGIDQLINGELSFDISKTPSPIKDRISTPEIDMVVPEKLELNGSVYNVRISHSPKPDFTQQSEAELLKQLYNYGIKPLKRKQAIKMLEFIYNQTHPIMLAPGEELKRNKNTKSATTSTLSTSSNVLSKSKSMPAYTSTVHNTTTHKSKEIMPSTQYTNHTETCIADLALPCLSNSASGEQLLRFSHELQAEMKDELYILQTNVTKKTPQPLLPLHIAWYNLLCANPVLHESVLTYEPIDLQQIYLNFKTLGYRYDPKDLKLFFDQRCIIFRYDLNPPGKPSERHVRKPKRLKSTKVR